MEMTNTPTQEEIAAMETTLSNYYSYDSQGCWGAASHSPHQKIDLEGDMSAVYSAILSALSVAPKYGETK